MIESCADVRVERIGAFGVIALDRAAKLNALSFEMIHALLAVLRAWTNDPTVRAVLLEGIGPRAFCAGGDVRQIYDRALAGDEGFGRELWAEEYRLDALIADYPKPIVALMSGIVMGGGVGLSAHASHRIVTDTTRFAMPEVSIGVIPDIGASWLFSRAPGELGTYLALTGESVGAGDVPAIGCADAYVPQTALAALRADLLAEPVPDDAAIRAVIARFSAPSPPSSLAAERPTIDACFAFDSVEAVLLALDRHASPFAASAAAVIRTKSPTSLKLTLRALREARTLPDLPTCLQREFRIISRVISGHDFREGVRAVVVEKDRRPAWSPAELAAVSPSDLDPYFAPFAGGDLEW